MNLRTFFNDDNNCMEIELWDIGFKTKIHLTLSQRDELVKALQDKNEIIINTR